MASGRCLSKLAPALMVASACSTSSSNNKPNQSSLTWKDCPAHPNDCNSGQTKQGGTMLVTDEKTITNFFVADANSNTYDQAQIMDGLIPSPFIIRPDSSVVLNTDMMDSATVTSTSPQTVVFKIKQTAIWMDGTPITADDFTFAWKFQNGKDCLPADCQVAGTTGYDSISNIVSSDNGKTATVTWSTPYPDWRALFALWPSKVAATYAGGDLYAAGGLKKAYAGFLNEDHPLWSGGPYMISAYTAGKNITLVRNPNWSAASDPNDPALPTQITVKTDWDPNQLDAAILAGTVDAEYDGGGLQTADVAKALDNPNEKKYTDNPAANATRYVTIDQDVAPFNNIHCREAVALALNKVDLINARGGSIAGAKEANTMLPPGVPGHDPNANPYPTGADNKGDVTAAKAQLQQCGQPTGFSTGIIIVNAGKGPGFATALQSALARVGITTQII